MANPQTILSENRRYVLKSNVEPFLAELFFKMAVANNKTMSTFLRMLIIKELRARNYLSDETIANLVTERGQNGTAA